MSISTVITLGFGSFGNVKYLPTLGYDTSGQPPPPPPVTTQVGGSGKDRRNEIIEVNGIRFSVPKDRVEEFLARFSPAADESKTVPVQFFKPETVSFLTPSGLTVTADKQVLKDDIGIILVMAALADEDFYE